MPAGWLPIPCGRPTTDEELGSSAALHRRPPPYRLAVGLASFRNLRKCGRPVPKPMLLPSGWGAKGGTVVAWSTSTRDFRRGPPSTPSTYLAPPRRAALDVNHPPTTADSPLSSPPPSPSLARVSSAQEVQLSLLTIRTVSAFND